MGEVLAAPAKIEDGPEWGKKEEKLSSVTSETPLSAKESGMWRLMCARVCLRCRAHCAGRSRSWCQALGLLRVSDWEGWISVAIAPRGATRGGVRQPVCLACWLQPLDEVQEVRHSWMSCGSKPEYHITSQYTS